MNASTNSLNCKSQEDVEQSSSTILPLYLSCKLDYFKLLLSSIYNYSSLSPSPHSLSILSHTLCYYSFLFFIIMASVLSRLWAIGVLFLVLNLLHGVRPDPQVPCYFIFGDSLVDNGNNNAIASLARANYQPYGIDFPNGPTGRFCNGRTTVDVIGKLTIWLNSISVLIEYYNFIQ